MSGLTGLLFLGGLLVAALEMVLARLWLRPYYSYGIPFVREVVDVSGAGLFIPGDESLGQFLKDNKCLVKVHPLGSGEIAFRDGPALHGLVRHHPESSTVSVTAYLDWMIPALAVSFLAVGAWFVVGLFGVYLFRAMSPRKEAYSTVARGAAAYWASLGAAVDRKERP